MIQQLKGKLGRWDPRRRSADFRRSIRNAVFNAGEGVLTPLLWIISTPIFVAQLGGEHFGIWILVNSVIGAGGLLSLGLTDATTKFVSKYRALDDLVNVRRVVGSTFLLYLGLGVFAFLLAFTLAPLLSGHVFELREIDRPVALIAIQIGGAGILARFADNVFFSVFQGFERFDLNVRINVLVNTLTILTNIILALSGVGLTVLLGVTVGFIMLGCVAKAILIRRCVDPGMSFVPRCTWASFQELMGFGFYTWIQRALSVLVTYADRLLLGAYVGMVEVGYYTICLQVLMQIVALLNRGGAFLFPFTSALVERGDHQRLRSVYNRSQFVLIILSCVLLLPVYVTGGSVLRLWMGPEFARQATFILELLCLRFVFAPLAIVNANYLMGMGLVKLQALLITLSSATLLAGLAWLVPAYGVFGAVLAQFLFFPFMLLNRFVVDRKLFHQLGVGQVLVFYLPVLVCMTAASVWVQQFPSGDYSLVECAGVLAGAAVVFGLLAWGVIRVCQKARLFPGESPAQSSPEPAV